MSLTLPPKCSKWENDVFITGFSLKKFMGQHFLIETIDFMTHTHSHRTKKKKKKAEKSYNSPLFKYNLHCIKISINIFCFEFLLANAICRESDHVNKCCALKSICNYSMILELLTFNWPESEKNQNKWKTC